MADTQTIPARTSSREGEELVRLVMSLGREARRLQRPVLQAAAASLGAALLSWLLCFSSYILDSFKSFLVCLGVLLVVAAPGAFLIWLHSLLRELSLLPGRLRPAEKIVARALPPPKEQGADTRVDRDWLGRARIRLDSVLEQWTLLSDFRKDLLRMEGSGRAVNFLSRPASFFAVAAALLFSALLILGAALSAVIALFSLLS